MAKRTVELPAGLVEAVAKVLAETAQAGTVARNRSTGAAPNRHAWVHQIKSQVEKYGADNASWCVSWREPDGTQRRRSCGPGSKGLKAAEKLADKTHSELVTGTYQVKAKELWDKFTTDYKNKIVAKMPSASRKSIHDTLALFTKLAKPKYVATITTEKIDAFITERLKANGIKKRKLSPATVNKDLRNLRTALRVAHDWGLIAKVPKFRMQKETESLKTYITPEHFAAVYQACGSAKAPSVPNIDAADWWRALFVLLYMTGWRVGQALSLKWADVDLDGATAITRADANGNKGKRDERIPLHPVVVEHLRNLKTFDERVFPWDQHYRKLWVHLWIIQKAATLPGHTEHDPKPLPQCGRNGWYGFHDIRRAFATCNAADMDLFELQKLMQHKSLATTQRYVNMASKLNAKVQNLFVPPVLISETA